MASLISFTLKSDSIYLDLIDPEYQLTTRRPNIIAAIPAHARASYEETGGGAGGGRMQESASIGSSLKDLRFAYDVDLTSFTKRGVQKMLNRLHVNENSKI